MSNRTRGTQIVSTTCHHCGNKKIFKPSNENDIETKDIPSDILDAINANKCPEIESKLWYIAKQDDLTKVKLDYIDRVVITRNFEDQKVDYDNLVTELKNTKQVHAQEIEKKNELIQKLDLKLREISKIFMNENDPSNFENLEPLDKANKIHEQAGNFKSEFDKLKSEKHQISEDLDKEMRLSLKPFVSKDESKSYEGIIKIASMKDLANGWKIELKNYQNYLERIERYSVVISVVGNYNKGKTWLLNKLCDAAGLPEGFSVNTEGISFAYTTPLEETKKTQTLAIDSKGGSLPVEIKDILSQSKNDEETLLEDDAFQKRFKERLTDHMSTEELLQNFVTDVSTVNIIVVSDITFEDQKLITRLKKKFSESSSSLIVVHNLFHCTTTEEIEKVHVVKIKNSFNITPYSYSFDVEKDQNRIYYEEIIGNKRVVHFIFARDCSEAGNYYNMSSIKFLNHMIDIMPQKKCNIIDDFHKYLKAKLPYYIQLNNLTEAPVILEQDENTECPIQFIFKDIENNKLKSISADESGMLQTNFCSYTCYSVKNDEDIKEDLDEKYIEKGIFYIKIEIPDTSKDEMQVKTKLDRYMSEFKIQVKGNKTKKSKKDSTILHDLRKEGAFQFSTPLHRINDNLKLKKLENIYMDGCCLVRYQYSVPSNE